ncbi:TcpQ domain-containing protein [Salinimonas chungwhensis]|uniref:TcpQ domain-containing protein n=1 Tax=Salinimonas chungwhensis TaxID=265425 RepID=UPI000372D4F4|nr:TcpQ domain-containing protein [Salinimonas chungwhensis]
MAKKTYSGKRFWARQFAVAVVLVLLAAALIYWQQNNVDETETRSVSKGLSDFYEQFKQGPEIEEEPTEGDFVIDLNGTDTPLETRLETMASELRPVQRNWVGEHRHRSFKAGSTLREAISGYAEKEGVQIIWDLNQDFVIKHHFQMDDTLVGSLEKIAAAIDSNFSNDVQTFVCPGERTMVITAKSSEYLDENCRQR